MKEHGLFSERQGVGVWGEKRGGQGLEKKQEQGSKELGLSNEEI